MAIKFWDQLTDRANGTRVTSDWWNQVKEIGQGSFQTGITAFAGGGQANATEIDSEYAIVSTVATAADSVKLPSAIVGRTVVVYNDASNSLDLFPQTGEQIESLGANNAIAIAGQSSRRFVCTTATNWRSVSASDASPNYAISSSSGSYTTSSGTLVDVTNLSVSLTTTGRPVLLMLIPGAGASDWSSYGPYNSSGSDAYGLMAYLRDSTIIGQNELRTSLNGATTSLSLANGMNMAVDVPSAGAYTYKVQSLLWTGTAVSFYEVKLFAIEL